jgi:hypothetical protein
MSPCLVQQLFRQKIGQELDQGIVDEFLFPLLFKEKHGPKELLLDIILTRKVCSSRVAVTLAAREAVLGVSEWHAMLDAPWRRLRRSPQIRPTLTESISPFEHKLHQSSAAAELRRDKPPGKVSGSLRRRRHMSAWGTIDILNEMRGQKGRFDEGRAGYYLEETTNPTEVQSCDIVSVDKFLEDAITTRKRLSWGGDPDINSHEKILSTYY